MAGRTPTSCPAVARHPHHAVEVGRIEDVPAIGRQRLGLSVDAAGDLPGHAAVRALAHAAIDVGADEPVGGGPREPRAAPAVSRLPGAALVGREVKPLLTRGDPAPRIGGVDLEIVERQRRGARLERAASVAADEDGGVAALGRGHERPRRRDGMEVRRTETRDRPPGATPVLGGHETQDGPARLLAAGMATAHGLARAGEAKREPLGHHVLPHPGGHGSHLALAHPVQAGVGGQEDRAIGRIDLQRPHVGGLSRRVQHRAVHGSGAPAARHQTGGGGEGAEGMSDSCLQRATGAGSPPGSADSSTPRSSWSAAGARRAGTRRHRGCRSRRAGSGRR